MNDVYSIILFMILIPVLILLTIAFALMKCAINDLKKEVEQHRARFHYLEFDYSSIENEYDIEGRIEKWYLKTRKGGDVVESMTDIEHALFGLSVDNPCGFIPQIFYPTLVEVIEAWIKKIANKYYESFIRKIDSTLSEVQNSIIENVSKHEEETNKIKGLIDKINNILKGF